MKKEELTLTPMMIQTKKPGTLWERVLSSRMLTRLARCYGEVLGQEVTARQALHLTNAQCAALMLFLPLTDSLCYAGLVLCWLLLALRGCKRSF